MRGAVGESSTETDSVADRSRAGTGFAANRLYRIMVITLASTTLLLLVSNLSVMVEQSAVLSVPLTVLALLVIGVPTLCQLGAGRCARRSVLRFICGALAIAMLFVYVGIGVTIPAGGLPVDMHVTWIGEMVIIPGVAAILAWTPRTAMLYGIVLFSTLLTVAVVCGEGQWRGTAAGGALRIIFFTTLFMCLAAALLKAGRTLDRTVDSAVAEARAAAKREAIRRSRRIVRMLVHDTIIVAMLSYVAGAQEQRAQTLARDALEKIGRGAVKAGEEPGDLSSDFVRELRTLTSDLDPQARFCTSGSGEYALPTPAARAFLESSAEALRNSIRHAPPDRSVLREVHVTLSPEHVEVVVLDDGTGFDPKLIPQERLGVRHGIITRMKEIAGGTAQVMSRRGYGTTVVLTWKQP